MKRLKGLFRDCKPIDQPQGTYRDAQNILVDKEEGAIVSEEGNISIDSIPTGFEIIGHTYIHDGRIILFLADGTDSKIGQLDTETETYTEILDEVNLNFQTGSRVEATNRINQDQEAIIYWTDDINSPRVLNIDNVPAISDINDLNIFDYIGNTPEIDLSNVNNSGGILSTGAYYFFISYIDNVGNRTSFLNASNPVYINDDINLGDADNYDGAIPGTPTSKSIELDITGIDTSFESVQFAVVKKEGGALTTPKVLPEVPIGSSNIVYTYTGNESFTETSLDDIFIDNASYETAKTLTQVDDSLYMGNLTGSPDLGYQKYANNIKLKVIDNRLDDAYGDGPNSFKNPDISFDMKSYKRDEVYAFYISFVLNDGTESKAYHIPGREANAGETDDASGTEEDLIDPNAKSFQFNNNADSEYNTGYWENENETYPTEGEDWEIWDVDSNGNGTKIGDLHDDGSGNPVPVRHHRMPDHDTFPIFEGDDSDGGDYYTLSVRLENIKIPSDITDKVRSIKVYYAKKDNSNRRILGQSYELCGFTIDMPNLDYNENVIVNYDPGFPNFSTESAPDSEPYRVFMPFSMMKDRLNVGSVSHLKTCYKPKLTFENISNDASIDCHRGIAKELYTPTIGIHKVNRSAYLENNIEVVELKSKGFSNNGSTAGSESFLLTEVENNYSSPWNTVLSGSDAFNGNSEYEMGYITEIMSHKTEVHNSFDLQELVWTGITESDIDKFNPANPSYTEGSKAEGVITITDNGSTTGEVSLGVVGYGAQKDFDYSVQSGDTKDDIATGLYNSFSMSEYSAVLDTAPSNPTITITANDVGTEFNTDISIINNVAGVGLDGVATVDEEITGGEDSSTWIKNIYGGDTFINRCTHRTSGWYADGASRNQRRRIWDFVCESYDNIEMRHQGGSFGEIYYPASSAESLVDLEVDAETPTDDSANFFTTFDNFYGYNVDYSSLPDLKTPIPFSKGEENSFVNLNTRIIRSQEFQTNQVGDGFRRFLENDYIDLPRNRGELVKLSVFDNTLMPHMERALIRTKGREELVAGDVRAFIGAGDIFSVNPDEIAWTEEGFGGLQDPETAIVTPFGYFFVDRDANRVFLMSEGLDPISEKGMRNFFSNELEGASSDQLLATWDDVYDRILLTYKGNWTISYSPKYESWSSFHSYDPEYYMSGLTNFFSLKNNTIYRHNEETRVGEFYGTLNDSYFEFIENRSPSISKIFENITFITDVIDQSGDSIYKETFDKFRVSNDHQDSDVQDIVVLSSLGDNSNARNVEGTWKINQFRDLIDHDTGNIDANKPWYEQSKFISKYLRVKLVFNNSSNKSLYLYDTDIGARKSIR